MVVNVAIHGSCARVVCTRVLATIINTGLVRGTIGVALAAKKHARDSRIASIAWRTLADSLVTDTVALGASAAGRERRRTRWNAVVLYTRVRSTALAVRSASGDFSANHVGISIVSHGARANRFMVGDAAIRIGTAGARVLAHRVHASLLRRAIVVPGALDLQDRLRGPASSTSAAHVTAWAYADHGANRGRWKYPALGWFAAGLYHGARVLALVVEAGQQIGAIGVLLAFRPIFRFAVHVRIAGVLCRATTDGQMVEDPALSSGRAGIAVDAWIHALHVDARVITWTVAVTVTANHSATVQSVPVVALPAPTIGFMVPGEALGVHAAVIGHQAGIHAAVVHAALVQRALAVPSTFYRVAGDVWIALVALVAGADRLVISHVAGGVRAAIAGIPALSVDAGFRVSAFVVRYTGADYRYLDWPADAVNVSSPALWTRAGHCPDRNRVQNVAACVLQTRSNNRAGIDALIPNAHQFVSAVHICSTFGLVKFCRGTVFAVRVRVSSRNILGAATGRQVVLDVADSVLSARRI